MDKRPLRGGILIAVIVVFACLASACGKPPADGLRDSFAQQLAANKFIKDFQRSGGDLRFSGPGPDGADRASWLVRIDNAAVEDNKDTSDAAHPYKGTITSSWFADGKLVSARGQDSNLPIELTSNGLAQDCWALWDKAARKWSWE
jgi:hypothetical protein